jgi:hypothetical protein
LLNLAAGRIVFRHDAEPRRQVPTVVEQLRIGDPGPERTSDQWANRGDRLQAWTQLARLDPLRSAVSSAAISVLTISI